MNPSGDRAANSNFGNEQQYSNNQRLHLQQQRHPNSSDSNSARPPIETNIDPATLFQSTVANEAVRQIQPLQINNLLLENQQQQLLLHYQQQRQMSQYQTALRMATENQLRYDNNVTLDSSETALQFHEALQRQRDHLARNLGSLEPTVHNNTIFDLLQQNNAIGRQQAQLVQHNAGIAGNTSLLYPRNIAQLQAIQHRSTIFPEIFEANTNLNTTSANFGTNVPTNINWDASSNLGTQFLDMFDATPQSLSTDFVSLLTTQQRQLLLLSRDENVSGNESSRQVRPRLGPNTFDSTPSSRSGGLDTATDPLFPSLSSQTTINQANLSSFLSDRASSSRSKPQLQYQQHPAESLHVPQFNDPNMRQAQIFEQLIRSQNEMLRRQDFMAGHFTNPNLAAVELAFDRPQRASSSTASLAAMVTNNQQPYAYIPNPRGSRTDTRKKKPKDHPKRPLSAYNLFFKEERLALLSRLNISSHESTDCTINEDAKEIESASKKRTKGETLGFEQMAKIIAENWKSVDRERLERYKREAAEDKERYEKELLEYNQKPESTSEGEKEKSEDDKGEI